MHQLSNLIVYPSTCLAFTQLIRDFTLCSAERSFIIPDTFRVGLIVSTPSEIPATCASVNVSCWFTEWQFGKFKVTIFNLVTQCLDLVYISVSFLPLKMLITTVSQRVAFHLFSSRYANWSLLSDFATSSEKKHERHVKYNHKFFFSK